MNMRKYPLLNKNYRTIAENCKRWRKQHGYTQEQIALSITHISRKTVSGFECGRQFSERILLWYLVNGMSKEELLENTTKFMGYLRND